MLCIGLRNAKEYDDSPILLASGRNDKEHLYRVSDSILPPQNCKHDNALEMLDKRTVYKLKKKYGVSAKLLNTLSTAFKNDSTKIEFGAEAKQLNSKCFIEDVEHLILGKLKTEVHSSFNWLPVYPMESIPKIGMATAFSGASGTGKSTLCATVLENSFKDENVTIWVFAPHPAKDPAFSGLRKRLGKRKVKLVPATDIQAPLHFTEVQRSPTNILVLDDEDGIDTENLQFIGKLFRDALFRGRHANLLCMTVHHDPFTRRRDSTIKAVCCEATRVFLFPHPKHTMLKYLRHRLGFDTKTIKKITGFLKPSDKWLYIQTHFPVYCLTSGGGAMLL